MKRRSSLHLWAFVDLRLLVSPEWHCQIFRCVPDLYSAPRLRMVNQFAISHIATTSPDSDPANLPSLSQYNRLSGLPKSKLLQPERIDVVFIANEHMGWRTHFVSLGRFYYINQGLKYCWVVLWSSREIVRVYNNWSFGPSCLLVQ